MLRAHFVVVGLLSVLAPSLAHADEPYIPPDFLAVTPELPAGEDRGAALHLDLADALRIAVRQNLDVALERKSIRIAALGIDVAGGAFEPTVTASYAHGDSNSPPSISQEGEVGSINNLKTDAWGIGVAQRFTTGTSVQVSFDNSRAKSTLGTAISPLNYRSLVSARVSQPLLRGFSSDLTIPRMDILRAQIASERERGRLVVSIADLVERTETAYWAVLQSLYRYDLSLRSLKFAEGQMTLTQRQIDAGSLPPSDVIGAESTLAERKLGLLQAEEEIHQASDQLRAILNLPRDQWSRPILPTDVPKFMPTPTSAEDALAVAIKSRPELAQLDLDLKDSVLSIRSADNAMRPQIDLGLEANAIGQESGYGGALGNLETLDGSGWSVSVNFTWTPLQRATRAAAEIARTRHEITLGIREQLVQKVWLEVRDAVRNQLGAERQVKAAAQFRVLAEKSLEIEQRKFLVGDSKNLAVAQRQDAVAAARLAELSALLLHNRSTAALLKATGRLLPERHIQLDVK